MKRFLALLLLLSLPAAALARTIEAEGIAATKQDAEREALRSAVERAIGTYVGSKTLVDKYTLIQDRILTYSQGYIQDYRVLDRRQRGDGLWLVKINANIDATADSKLLSELARQGIINVVLRNPKIAVQINYGENSAVGNWAGAALTEELVNTGFKRAVPGELADADFVITGFAKSLGEKDVGKYLGNGKKATGTISSRVSISAQLLQVSTGKTIAFGTRNIAAVASGRDYAIKKASAKAGAEMGKYIVEKLLELGSGPEIQGNQQ